MSGEIAEIRELQLKDLKPFSLRNSQTYQGERLEQLMSSIRRVGLTYPIIVRPCDDGKYEIICGHNRVLAIRKLGHDVIRAEVRTGLSNDEAIELFYDTNLNQQSFGDWNYAQKFKAIQYTEKLIKENSQQGKRNDLDKNDAPENRTCVQGRHKSDRGSRRSTTRDRMARRLGISTATLSKYRSIIKLSNEQVESIARLLDEGKITFTVAYIMSKLKPLDFSMVLDGLGQLPDKKIDPDKLKQFSKRGTDPDKVPVFSKELVRGLFVPR